MAKHERIPRFACVLLLAATACASPEERRVRTAVESMELLERRGINGQVLQMNNLQQYGFDLDVRCHRADGVVRTLFIKIHPRSLSEAGSSQGWRGNFQAGEWCELMYRGKVIRTYHFGPPIPLDVP